MAINRRMLAEAVWKTIVMACNQGGRTRVALPYRDVVEVLLSLTANVISQVDDAQERERMLREMGPKVSNLVDGVRSRTDTSLASKPRDLILPH